MAAEGKLLPDGFTNPTDSTMLIADRLQSLSDTRILEAASYSHVIRAIMHKLQPKVEECKMSGELRNVLALGIILLVISGCAGMQVGTAESSHCGPYGDQAKCPDGI